MQRSAKSTFDNTYFESGLVLPLTNNRWPVAITDSCLWSDGQSLWFKSNSSARWPRPCAFGPVLGWTDSRNPAFHNQSKKESEFMLIF